MSDWLGGPGAVYEDNGGENGNAGELLPLLSSGLLGDGNAQVNPEEVKKACK